MYNNNTSIGSNNVSTTSAALFGNNSTNKKAESKNGFDFFSMLSNRINIDDNKENTTKDFSRGLNLDKLGFFTADLKNQFGSIPVPQKIEKPQKADIATNKADTAQKKEKSQDVSETKTTKTESENKENNVENENQIDGELTNETVLEVLLNEAEGLSEEQKLLLTKDPENFDENLKKLAEEMPDSEMKEALLAIIDNEALTESLKATLVQVPEQITVSATANEEAALDQEINVLNKKSTVETKTKPEHAIENNETEGDDANVAIEGETEQSNVAELKAGHEKNKSADKEEKPELNNEVISKESIRKEFERIHKTDEVAEQANLTAEPSEAGSIDESILNDLFGGESLSENVSPELTKAAQNLAAKFFGIFADEKSPDQGKKDLSQAFGNGMGKHADNAGSIKSGSASNGGMNNGFSFHSQNASSEYAGYSKTGQTAATSYTNFTEMLQKAEMVKTRDGAKILSIEVEQNEMGKLEMELKSKDGVVTARLMAESESVKAELEKLTPQIREELLNRGVNLEVINVDVSSNNPDKRQASESESVSRKSKLSVSKAGDDFEELLAGSSAIDVLANLRREALNIQYVDELV
ncbi:MAG: flagellar hook-length control protein FliK [Candidatus Riflebacteria bacterium]|nr:flagellar hook-length control protein FliK [Candidatus Riflebacteria bacterium]